MMLRRALLVLLLGLATFLACGGKTTQEGALVAVITTDFSRSEMDAFRIEVSQETTPGTYGAPLVAKDFAIQSDTTLPATFTIAAGQNAHQMALVRVVGKKGSAPVVLREIEVLVPKDRVLALPVLLSKACAGQFKVDSGRVVSTCPQAHESCQPATGACGSSVVDDSTLAPYGVGAAGSGGDAEAPIGPDEKEITSFVLGGVTATISGNDIFAQLTPGAKLDALTPTIKYRAAKIDPDPSKPQSFALPVTYTAVAQNGTSRVYTVHASVATSTSKEILSFVVTGATTLYPQLPGDNGILLEFPFGSDVTHVTPTIAYLGQSIEPGNLVPQDFTNAVTYTVTAYDGSKRVYTVKAEIQAADTARIDSFKLNGVAGDIIPEASITVALGGVPLSNLVPEIQWIGGSIDPPANQAQDFTNPITYTVTSADKSNTVQYVVTVKRPTVSDPTFSPLGGRYGHPIEVNITCATPGGVVHYTTGTGPSNEPTESSPVYVPVTFPAGSVAKTLNARCFAANYEPAQQAKFQLYSVAVTSTIDAPAEIDFGPTNCGDTASSQTFTLQNPSSDFTMDTPVNFTLSPTSGPAASGTQITVQPKQVPLGTHDDITNLLTITFPGAGNDIRNVTLRQKVTCPP